MTPSINNPFLDYHNILNHLIPSGTVKITTKSSFVQHIPVRHGGKNSLKNTHPDLVDFSANIAPAGISSSVMKSLQKNLDIIQTYPDLHSTELLSKLKKYTHLPKSNLIVGNGAIEIIYNFCSAFLSEKTKVLIHIPTFQEYETAAKLNDCNISFFKVINLSETIDDFLLQIPRNGCVFLCNPNNPTGKLLRKKHLLQIIKTAKKLSSIVFVDECFIELVPESNESVISYVQKYDNLFVLRSLTKSFGLPGLRIGYAAGSKQMVEILQKIKIPWSVNSLAQRAAIVSLQNNSNLAKSKIIIKKELAYLINTISKLPGFECYDSTTNFVLIKTKQDSATIQQKLFKENILIRDCRNFRGLDDHHIRIAVKSHKNNVKLVHAMERLV